MPDGAEPLETQLLSEFRVWSLKLTDEQHECVVEARELWYGFAPLISCRCPFKDLLEEPEDA